MGHGGVAGKANVTNVCVLLHGSKQIENASKGCDKGAIMLSHQRIGGTALMKT